MNKHSPDPSKGLGFQMPTTNDLHLRIEQMAAQIVRLTARVQQLEEKNIND